jgi:hypothetical protein
MPRDTVERLVTRMMDKPEFAVAVNEAAEYELAGESLSDEELEAVLADAAAIVAARHLEQEVSGVAMPTLRSPRLAGFEAEIGADLTCRYEALVGGEPGRGARGVA